MNSQNFLKDPNTNWKYIIIIALLAFLVGGGILGYQYWWLPKQEVKMPEIEIPEREAPEEAEVPADWETYVKGERYTFKYPPDMDNQCCNIGGTSLPGEERDIVFAQYPTAHKERIYGGGPFTDGLMFGVYSQPNEDNETFQSYIQRVKPKFVEVYKEVYDGKTPVDCGEKQRKIGNYNGIELAGCSPWGVSIIFLKHPTEKLIVTISWMIAGEKTQEYEKIFNQILSTFRFLE